MTRGRTASGERPIRAVTCAAGSEQPYLCFIRRDPHLLLAENKLLPSNTDAAVGTLFCVLICLRAVLSLSELIAVGGGADLCGRAERIRRLMDSAAVVRLLILDSSDWLPLPSGAGAWTS